MVRKPTLDDDDTWLSFEEAWGGRNRRCEDAVRRLAIRCYEPACVAL